MHKTNHASKFISILQELHKLYPHQSISFHLSFILEEYPNFDSLTDKELYNLAVKYKAEKEMDIYPSHNQDELDKIIKDAEDLDHILDEDEDEDF